MRSPPAATADLLAWPILQEAQLRAERAETDRAAAWRRYRLAPHGEKANRAAAFRRAVTAALAAEIELRRLVKETSH